MNFKTYFAVEALKWQLVGLRREWTSLKNLNEYNLQVPPPLSAALQLVSKALVTGLLLLTCLRRVSCASGFSVVVCPPLCLLAADGSERLGRGAACSVVRDTPSDTPSGSDWLF